MKSSFPVALVIFTPSKCSKFTCVIHAHGTRLNMLPATIGGQANWLRYPPPSDTCGGTLGEHG